MRRSSCSETPISLSAETKKFTDKDAELTMATDKIKELTEAVKKFDGVDVEKIAVNKKLCQTAL